MGGQDDDDGLWAWPKGGGWAGSGGSGRRADGQLRPFQTSPPTTTASLSQTQSPKHPQPQPHLPPAPKYHDHSQKSSEHPSQILPSDDQASVWVMVPRCKAANQPWPGQCPPASITSAAVYLKKELTVSVSVSGARIN